MEKLKTPEEYAARVNRDAGTVAEKYGLRMHAPMDAVTK